MIYLPELTLLGHVCLTMLSFTGLARISSERSLVLLAAAASFNETEEDFANQS